MNKVQERRTGARIRTASFRPESGRGQEGEAVAESTAVDPSAIEVSFVDEDSLKRIKDLMDNYNVGSKTGETYRNFHREVDKILESGEVLAQTNEPIKTENLHFGPQSQIVPVKYATFGEGNNQLQAVEDKDGKIYFNLDNQTNNFTGVVKIQRVSGDGKTLQDGSFDYVVFEDGRVTELTMGEGGRTRLGQKLGLRVSGIIVTAGKRAPQFPPSVREESAAGSVVPIVPNLQAKQDVIRTSRAQAGAGGDTPSQAGQVMTEEQIAEYKKLLREMKLPERDDNENLQLIQNIRDTNEAGILKGILTEEGYKRWFKFESEHEKLLRGETKLEGEGLKKIIQVLLRGIKDPDTRGLFARSVHPNNRRHGGKGGSTWVRGRDISN